MTTTMEPTDRQLALLRLATGMNYVDTETLRVSFRYRGVDGYRRARCDSGTGDTFRQVGIV